MGTWQLSDYASHIVGELGPDAVAFVTQQVLDADGADHDALDFWLDVTRCVVSMVESQAATGTSLFF